MRMVCPVCPAVGMVGGYVGGYFGINQPEDTTLRVVGGVITASMIVITVVALRCFFDLSICDGLGNFSLRNIIQVACISLVLGLIYSLVVNCILNRLFSEAPKNANPAPLQISAQKPCCCCENSDDL